MLIGLVVFALLVCAFIGGICAALLPTGMGGAIGTMIISGALFFTFGNVNARIADSRRSATGVGISYAALGVVVSLFFYFYFLMIV